MLVAQVRISRHLLLHGALFIQLSWATLDLGCIVVIASRLRECLCGISLVRLATATEEEPYYAHNYQRSANTPDNTTSYRAFVR